MSHWIEHDAQWYEQRLVHCGCCGRLIAKNLLVAEIDGKRTIFCSEDCEEIYSDYIISERGSDYRPPTDVLEQYNALMVR